MVKGWWSYFTTGNILTAWLCSATLPSPNALPLRRCPDLTWGQMAKSEFERGIFKAGVRTVKPLFQDNSLIEGRCWQVFSIIWLLHTEAIWLSYRKLCCMRGSNYVPKEGKECTWYTCRLQGDYKEYRCARTSLWQSILSGCRALRSPVG